MMFTYIKVIPSAILFQYSMSFSIHEIAQLGAFFNDGFILAGLGSYPPDRVATLGALLMLATLVIDVALIVLPVVCLWYYRSIRPVGAVPSLLLVFSGLGALLSWLLIVPQWAMWAWDDESFLETLANAGQDTKLICVLFGIPALIGGILILGRRKRWAELVPA